MYKIRGLVPDIQKRGKLGSFKLDFRCSEPPAASLFRQNFPSLCINFFSLESCMFFVRVNVHEFHLCPAHDDRILHWEEMTKDVEGDVQKENKDHSVLKKVDKFGG